MPRLPVNGTELRYEEAGSGPETIVFSHGLLMDRHMFAAQMAYFAGHPSGRYRCVAYDHRGQGESAGSDARVIDMETVAADAAALIEALDAAPCHFAGLSMGGFAAMRLAARRPELLRSCILMNTTAEPEANRFKYRLLNLAARWLGPRFVQGAVEPIMFGRSFREDPARAEAREAVKARMLGLDRSIWRAVNGVIERADVSGEVAGIGVPTLVIVCGEDAAIPPEKAARTAAMIPGAAIVRLPHAGHSSTIEDPEGVSAAVEAFLANLEPAPGA